jgi:hypothetical protein
MPARKPPPKRKPAARTQAAVKRLSEADDAKMPGGAKRPPHRPPYEPSDKDRQTVRVMVAGGIEQAHIQDVLEISKTTLRKYFRRDIETAAHIANAAVVASLHKMATAGENVHAAKFWLQARMGWQERMTVKDGGIDDSDLSALTDEQLNARLAEIDRHKGRGKRT